MLGNKFKLVVDAVRSLRTSYDKSVDEFHRSVRDLPPEVQVSVYSSMHLRR